MKHVSVSAVYLASGKYVFHVLDFHTHDKHRIFLSMMHLPSRVGRAKARQPAVLLRVLIILRQPVRGRETADYIYRTNTVSRVSFTHQYILGPLPPLRLKDGSYLPIHK